MSSVNKSTIDEMLVMAFGSQKDAQEWLRKPHDGLGGVPPALRLAQGEAWAKQVVDLLDSRAKFDSGGEV